MKYNGLILYYVLNQQGDVVRLIDSEGVNYGSYKYDAWGNILQMANTKYINNNPLRYRGYVYDPETELYYCQSRYYDPKIGRFINADALVSTGQGLLGNNMFAYCGNNPINRMDTSGTVTVDCYRDEDSLFRRMLEGSSGGGYRGGGISIPFILPISASSSDEKGKEVSISVPYDTDQRQYTVYFLYAEGGDPNKIVYVGRVLTANFDSRMAYHEKQGRLLSGKIDGLNYALCRVIEQGGMMYHHTINREIKINNQIRGISPLNKNLYTYLAAIFDVVGRNAYPDNGLLPLSYWENFTENEFLNGDL